MSDSTPTDAPQRAQGVAVDGDDGEAAGADQHGMTIAAAIVLLIGGMVIGFFGGFLQAVTVAVAAVSLPVGLVVVLAALVACIRAVIHMFHTRKAGLMVLIGWLVPSVALALPGPGGDIVIGANAIAIVYLFGGVVIGTACVNVPARLRPTDEDSRSDR